MRFDGSDQQFSHCDVFAILITQLNVNLFPKITNPTNLPLSLSPAFRPCQVLNPFNLACDSMKIGHKTFSLSLALLFSVQWRRALWNQHNHHQGRFDLWAISKLSFSTHISHFKWLVDIVSYDSWRHETRIVPPKKYFLITFFLVSPSYQVAWNCSRRFSERVV